MPLDVENAVVQHGRSASPNITLSTTTADDLAVVMVYNESTSGAAKTVTSVTATGLTFTRLGGVSAGVDNAEVWAAPVSGTLSSEVITVNLSGTPDAECLVAFGVKGLYNNSNPKDSNASSAAGSTYANPASVSLTTSQANDILLAVTGTHNSPSGEGTWPSGWAKVAGTLEGSGSNWCGISVAYKVVSATQSGITVQFQSQDANALLFALALTADNNAPAQTLTPPLFTNTNSFFSPTVGTSIDLTPALFTDSDTFYSPTISQSSGGKSNSFVSIVTG